MDHWVQTRRRPRYPIWRLLVPDHVYKVVELVGYSPDGIEASINGALLQANKTIRNLDWFEVREIRGTSRK